MTHQSVTEATPLTVKSGKECTPTGVLVGRSRRIPIAPIPPGYLASLPARPIPEGSPITKYNATDGKKILEPEDDAATVKLGAPWRMPTEDEIKELVDKCTWTWTTQDGKNGYKVIGPNGNSIFLPAGGLQETLRKRRCRQPWRLLVKYPVNIRPLFKLPRFKIKHSPQFSRPS